MKNYTKIAESQRFHLCAAALVAVIGLSFIGCGGGVSSKKLADHLASLDQKTVDTPTTVKLAKMTFTTAFPALENTIAWAEINNTVKTAQKYIILDLSACTAADNIVTGQFNPKNNDMNIIRENGYIVGIILPLNLTSIGECAFVGCNNLTTITIPNSVTTIGVAAFRNCYNLASVTIGIGVTTIEDNAFAVCDLTSVIIPLSVTSIGKNAFDRGCKVNVEPANTAYSSTDSVLFDKTGTTLIQQPSKKHGNILFPMALPSLGTTRFGTEMA